jgi:hypothetical protein
LGRVQRRAEAAKENGVKFDAKYPDKASAQKLYPEKLMGPHKEVEVTSEVTQSWRVYPCSICGVPTGWRWGLPNADFPASPACSEECVAELKLNAVDLDLPSEGT